MSKSLDKITTENSAFKSFDAMLNASGGYRPSIEVASVDGWEDRVILADAYDEAMEARGDDRRAYRYGAGK